MSVLPPPSNFSGDGLIRSQHIYIDLKSKRSYFLLFFLYFRKNKEFENDRCSSIHTYFVIKWIFSIHIKLSFIIIQICFIQYSNLKTRTKKKQNKKCKYGRCHFSFCYSRQRISFFFSLVICLSCLCHVAEVLI